MPVRLNGSTSGYSELSAPAVAGSNTLVLPTGNGTNGQVLTTNGSGALSWGAGSKILQVVSTTFTSEFSWTTKGSWVNMTGISASITPTAATSNILVQVMLSTGDGGNNYERVYRVTRNGTNIVEGPNTASIMTRASFGTGMGSYSSNSAIVTVPYLYFDSPSSTSALTYQLQGWASASSVTTSYINRPYLPSTASSGTGISTITLTEVAA
jgi:hypothetical protein